MNSLKISILITGLLLFSCVSLAGATVINSRTGQTYATIQEAIDNASDGDELKVMAGTYGPFVVDGFNKLTIEGEGKVVVKGSISVTTAYGARDAVIFIRNSKEIKLEDLDIQGQNLGLAHGGTNLKSYAVIFENSSGKLEDCTVSPNTVGDVYGIAIGMWDFSRVKIESCKILNYGRVGILAYDILRGEVKDSIIEGARYNGSDPNLVSYGIEIESWAVSSEFKIASSDISGNYNGQSPTWSSAGVYIDGWSEYYTGLPHSKVQIEESSIHDNQIGIWSVNNSVSVISNNDIYGNFDYGIFNSANVNGHYEVLNATCNYWGDSTGPYHPTLNPDGLGDKVSDNVVFKPWLKKSVFSEEDEENKDKDHCKRIDQKKDHGNEDEKQSGDEGKKKDK